MRKPHIVAVITVMSVLVMAGCSHSAEKDGLGHHHGHEKETGTGAPGHDEGSDAGHQEESDIIHMSQSQAQKFGVATESVEPRVFNEVIAVSGEILPVPTDQSVASAPSSGIISFNNGVAAGMHVVSGQALATISAKNMAGGDAIENARIVYEAAKRELERVRPLHEDGIVSTRDYNAAEENFRKAQAAYAGTKSGGIVSCPRTGVVSEIMVQDGAYVEAGTPVATISSNQRLTLRADVPERYRNSIGGIKTANFKLSSSDVVMSVDSLGGKKVSSSPAVVKGGYIPVYFSFDNDGTLSSGAFAEVYLIGTGRDDTMSVPVGAVTEQQGEKFVYLRIDDDCYRKVPVSVGPTDGRRVEIRSGINAGDNVVVQGVTFVRLAENNGAVPEGHSHTH